MSKKKRTTLSDELRQAIAHCGISRYEISKQTGIDAAALSRFMSGERGLMLPSIDALAEFLNLHIVRTINHAKASNNGRYP